MRFVLIDRIDRLEPGRRAEGHKQVSPDEDYFRDHFPGYPIVPGVIVLESLAQLGGRLVEATVRDASGRRVLPVLARVDHAKFLQPVRPGDRLDLEVGLAALSEDAARVTGTARVAGRRAASAEIMYAVLDTAQGARLDETQAAALHDWSDRIWQELRGDR
ncbi:MAG: 3-hydroxyacyl-ACP dehydratase FabZ family protein [Betaproteobacteria bacterium]